MTSKLSESCASSTTSAAAFAPSGGNRQPARPAVVEHPAIVVTSPIHYRRRKQYLGERQGHVKSGCLVFLGSPAGASRS